MANDNKTNSTATVTIGCKLPHGYHMELHDKEGQVIERHTVAGANASEVIGGHGITVGVPKEFWEEWVRRNKAQPMVQNGLIFAHDSASNVAGEASEKRDNRSGFEGINPDKPGAAIGNTSETTGIVKADKK